MSASAQRIASRSARSSPSASGARERNAGRDGEDGGAAPQHHRLALDVAQKRFGLFSALAACRRESTRRRAAGRYSRPFSIALSHSGLIEKRPLGRAVEQPRMNDLHAGPDERRQLHLGPALQLAAAHPCRNRRALIADAGGRDRSSISASIVVRHSTAPACAPCAWPMPSTHTESAVVGEERLALEMRQRFGDAAAGIENGVASRP